MVGEEEKKQRLLLLKEERYYYYYYYEGCPGCKMELNKEMTTGLPIWQLLSMWIVVLSTVLPISSLFPFLYFMIRYFHVAEREADIRFYAGYVADRYSRKPVIIFRTISVFVLNTLFGLRVNFWMAVVMRFLLGIMNGLLAPIKAYSSEIFRKEYQALGISTVSTAWGIGLIIGPAIGGFLAQIPYFLPCLETLHARMSNRYEHLLPRFDH